ncbi:MAG: HAD family hydrolase [Thiothrix sp.]|nr:HAD family hydrolase [Thiothrix sp.]HPE59883.1 HAD family hydrolase [Thiolinea sp.]
MTLALFDLDHTLLSADSDYHWGQFLVSRGLVDTEQYAQANHQFYQQYKAGTLDIHEYFAFSMRAVSEQDMATARAWHRDYMQAFVLPYLGQPARDLVEKHRALGHTLVIITATNSFVTAPIAAEFGVENLLAIEPVIENGRYTNRIAGVPSFREGKVTRLQQWLQGRNETLEGSWFYSDSHNDLPLLELVDHPVAVDPDEQLLARAQQQGWPVISLNAWLAEAPRTPAAPAP